MPQTLTIDLTAHAIERFRDRVRPGLDLDAAADELARLAGVAEVTPLRPEWLNGFALLYLVVGDVALPLEPSHDDPERLTATTCLVRGYRRPRFAVAA
jgi:hypothetical protein